MNIAILEVLRTFHHFDVFNTFLIQNKATVSGEIGDVISGKLAVPKGKTTIFKSLGKLELKNSCKPRPSHSLTLLSPEVRKPCLVCFNVSGHFSYFLTRQNQWVNLHGLFM